MAALSMGSCVAAACIKVQVAGGRHANQHDSETDCLSRGRLLHVYNGKIAMPLDNFTGQALQFDNSCSLASHVVVVQKTLESSSHDCRRACQAACPRNGGVVLEGERSPLR